MSTLYFKYSTWPPWYELSAMPCASSCSAAVTTSSTERLWPRWITSAPIPIRMRRMMLIAASWPSNSEAAVTKRTLWVGRYCARALYSAERSVMVVLSSSGARRTPSSHDAEPGELRVAGRIAQLHVEQRLLQHQRHHQVAVRLRIGRHHGPRRPRRSGRGH